jgi:hypothetical protein
MCQGREDNGQGVGMTLTLSAAGTGVGVRGVIQAQVFVVLTSGYIKDALDLH